MKKILLGLILFCVAHAGFTTVTLQLESSKVQAGDTVRLILTLDGAEADNVPDLTPLQKEFTIVGTERSMNYTVINGRAQSMGQWLILLLPKKTGILTIPEIQVGQEKTAPATLEVTEESLQTQSSDSNQPKDVKLLVEVSEENPFINQQIIYTVKLYNSRHLVNADYQPPQVEDALLIPLETGRRYQTAENGRLYTVEEQRYAIFPQKSGPLKIIPPTFNAVIYEAVPKRVRERAKPISINVKPVPTPYTGKTWLPAKQVNLSESYDNSGLSLQQGTTLVRTVTLQATAVPAQLLPRLDFGSSTDFSIYPEKPVEKNSFQQSDLVGTITFKMTYLFNKAGQITIPAFKLMWFNTVTGKEEIAALPERIIQIRATNNVTSNTTKSSAIPAAQSLKEAPSVDNPAVVAKKETTELAPAVNASSNLGWWIALVFALAWLLTLGLWFWQRMGENSRYTRKHALKNLQDACLRNDASAARDALMHWAHKQWPDTNLLNLTDVESKVDDVILREQIRELAQALYHKNAKASWRGEPLWRAILSFKEKGGKTTTHNNNSLPPMHKL
ncbi:BatD family protein [Legionella clemsonensis]|uniref:DUF7939 domain-containing protein n=1 Tax=Legionella clemsonensis TaxID=1867846 RepID=A0A222NYP2_9GAMM|nr:BatD family protein [Legionella clemsonensis]ASQ44710.1 hypothetical protein clem_00720 [Legionella clemsonensis]